MQLAAQFGVFPGPAYPLASMRLAAGEFSFVLSRGQHGAPCVDYRVPGSGGGNCFVAVGLHCQWALEAVTITAGDSTVAYGAAVPRAARVRFGPRGPSISTGKVVDWVGLRVFAVAVPTSVAGIPPDEVVALDAHGQLLGRQHYNDGRGGFGASDGLIDRACIVRGRRQHR